MENKEQMDLDFKLLQTLQEQADQNTKDIAKQNEILAGNKQILKNDKKELDDEYWMLSPKYWQQLEYYKQRNAKTNKLSETF